jgi:hypothetical protein
MGDPLKALHLQFRKMERRKREIYIMLETLTPERQQQNPDPHSWSVMQIVHHLYLSERNSLAYLRKKLSYPDLVPHYNPKSWGGILLIKLVFFLHIRVKAPVSIDSWKVMEVLPTHELKDKWDDLRHELISFVEVNQPAFGKHLAFRHPYAGRLTMYQMFIFMNDHLRHHQQQIWRTLQRLS